MYIEREKLLRQLEIIPSYGRYIDIEAVEGLVRDMPAAEVAPVVRCRECAYSDDAWVTERGFLICPASGMDISGDDFCSYGERREA